MVVAAYAWWATGLRPFSGSLTAAVLGAGFVAMAAGATGRRSAGSRTKRRGDLSRGVAVWAVLFVAGSAWEVGAYLQEPRSDHPTVSSLFDGVLDPHPVRAVAFLGWLAAAAALARR